MNCTSPNYMIDLGVKENGKKNLKMITVKEYNLLVQGKNEYPKNIIEVPCGRCIACRLNYAKDWATRCMLEAKQYQHNEFLTLTYDPEHLPMKKKIDYKTGEVIINESLVKKDLQDFWKRLRKKYPGIRYFACGEYGEKKDRPHYHAIIFNFEVKDKEKLKGHFNSEYPKFTSKEILKIWGKGRISLDEVNYNTCEYVARYIMKKQKGRGAEDFYEEKNKVPEFTIMSRKPGIARDFYESIKGNYENQVIWNKTRAGMRKAKTPRYFEKLYDLEFPEELKAIKEKKKEMQEEALRLIMSQTDKNREEYLQVQEDNLWAKLQKSAARKLKKI